MNLSNRLTFSLIFSVVLVALFAFTIAPAMAQVAVTAQVTEIVAAVQADTTATPPVVAVQAKRVVTIKYSIDADSVPVVTGPDDTNTPADTDSNPDVLAVTTADKKRIHLRFWVLQMEPVMLQFLHLPLQVTWHLTV